MSGVNFTTHQNTGMPQPTMPTDRQFGSLSPQLLGMLREAISEAGKAPGKDLVALIGNTGTGKSTAVNDFTGHRIVYAPVMIGNTEVKVMKVAEGEGIAKIGHEGSQTLYTQVYPDHPIPSTSLVLADSGGFLDTRGADKELTVLTSLKLVLENAKSVRLILCCKTNDINFDDRGVQFATFIQTALGKLLKDYQSCPKSVFVMFTKPPRFESEVEEDAPPFTIQSAIRWLNRCKEIYPHDSELRKIYEYLLRENGKYIGIYKPTVSSTKDNVIRVLKEEMVGIENPRGFFRMAHSPAVQLKLTEVMTEISLHGTRLYQSFFNNILDIERLAEEKGRIEGRADRIKEALEVIGDGNGDPEVIQRNVEAIMEQQEAIIREQRENILRCEREENEVKATKESIQQKLDLLQTDGDREEEYWKDSINQEGINIVTTETTTTHHESSGVFKSSSSQETTTRKIDDKRPTERNFYYRGPEITRIELSPKIDAQTAESKPYWSNLNPQNPVGSDSFSAHYQTADGEDAIAEIKVFVQKKNLPMTMLKTGQHIQEFSSQSEKMHRLSEEKRGYERIISEAERSKDTQGNIIDKIAQYKANIEELESEIQRIQSDILSLESENQSIKESIHMGEENFMFLKNYLQLSQDSELADGEAVKQFLQLDERFASL